MLLEHIDRCIGSCICHNRQPIALRVQLMQRLRHTGEEVGGQGCFARVFDLSAFIHDRIAKIEQDGSYAFHKRFLYL
jgi:hypothetical protein